MKILFPLFICLVLAGCGPSRPVRSELTGTHAERVTKATAILGKYCKLPGPLLDAHMVEDVQNNSGGLVPGPSDSWLSGVLTVPSEDLPKWRAMLAPQVASKSSADLVSFVSPIAPPSWWPAAAVLQGCEFYSPQKLTGRSGGFVAVSPSSVIYFSTTKM